VLNQRGFFGAPRVESGMKLANYTQERSVNHRGAQLVRTGIVAGRSGQR
jgi:hypothetical protein